MDTRSENCASALVAVFQLNADFLASVQFQFKLDALIYALERHAATIGAHCLHQFRVGVGLGEAAQAVPIGAGP